MKLLSLLNSPWAIVPDKLVQLQGIYADHLKRPKIDIAEIEAQIGHPLQRKEQGYTVQGKTALIPVDGPIAKKMNLFSQVSGGASTELIKRDFLSAMHDNSVDQIILQIDSPGGTVDGTQELAQTIFGARGKGKKIIAYCDGMMASAAYWIGSAADEIYISSDTAAVGSIGVVATHMDISKAEEKQGVKTTEITAGRYKRISSQHGPLTDEGQAVIQAQVDHLYSVFVADVARNRGVEIGTVLEQMADGRIFIGTQAVEAGLVDGVSTLDTLLQPGMSANGINLYKPLAGSATGQPEIKEITTMTIEQFKAENPELAAAIAAEATAGHADALATARTEAAATERQRIADCRAQLIPGHEALVDAMAFDGTSSPADVALAIVGAEKQLRAGALSTLEEEAPPAAPPAEDQGMVKPAENDTTEAAVKSRFEASADLQKEFGSFGSYHAYIKATTAGRARILGK